MFVLTPSERSFCRDIDVHDSPFGQRSTLNRRIAYCIWRTTCTMPEDLRIESFSFSRRPFTNLNSRQYIGSIRMGLSELLLFDFDTHTHTRTKRNKAPQQQYGRDERHLALDRRQSTTVFCVLLSVVYFFSSLHSFAARLEDTYEHTHAHCGVLYARSEQSIYLACMLAASRKKPFGWLVDDCFIRFCWGNRPTLYFSYSPMPSLACRSNLLMLATHLISYI